MYLNFWRDRISLLYYISESDRTCKYLSSGTPRVGVSYHDISRKISKSTLFLANRSGVLQVIGFWELKPLSVKAFSYFSLKGGLPNF
ncbi:hypothetical protein [Calothrix sp. PCC 6303]|uniref:hypothetical protein n=1 Tax=Calothrix sp. PCC 6303 TaxID=1170562 RepID=UPI0002E6701F|nr:hypothetical protein [Calothrix sp. PCC 6303]